MSEPKTPDTLGERLRAVRDAYLMATPDKTDTAWAILTEAADLIDSQASALAEARKALEAWEWLTADRRLSIQAHGPVYGDDDDQTEEWRVFRESGNINDREWDVVGAGPNALSAVLAARVLSGQGASDA